MGNGTALQASYQDELQVMLIDDDEVVNTIHEATLIRSVEQISTTQFLGAVEALNWLKSTPPALWPDLILLDLNMPGMNGWQFLDEYLKLPHKTVLYVVSSSIDPVEIQKAKSYPCVADYITKPLTHHQAKAIFGEL